MLEFLFRVVFSWLAGLCPSGVRSIWVVTEHCTNFFVLIQWYASCIFENKKQFKHSQHCWAPFLNWILAKKKKEETSTWAQYLILITTDLRAWAWKYRRWVHWLDDTRPFPSSGKKVTGLCSGAVLLLHALFGCGCCWFSVREKYYWLIGG